MFVLLLTAQSAQIDPKYAANLTLYHEGPPELAKLGLVNQDTGDALGDAYFVLRGLMLPVECKSKSSFAHFDCDNPEQNSTKNIISQHIVTVDSRFGTYGSCNADSSGAYQCYCGWHKKCGAPVGQCDVASRESRYPIPGSEAWMYWRDNLATKVGGNWYSTIDSGRCATADAVESAVTAADGASCTWRLVRTVRQIVAQCLETRIAQAIVAHNQSCFDKCPQPQNASTACVVDCYYSTLLGPRGGSSKITPAEGMPLDLIQDAWTNAFASSDAAKGGCPDAADSASEGPWPLSWSKRARALGQPE